MLPPSSSWQDQIMDDNMDGIPSASLLEIKLPLWLGEITAAWYTLLSLSQECAAAVTWFAAWAYVARQGGGDLLSLC